MTGRDIMVPPCPACGDTVGSRHPEVRDAPARPISIRAAGFAALMESPDLPTAPREHPRASLPLRDLRSRQEQEIAAGQFASVLATDPRTATVTSAEPKQAAATSVETLLQTLCANLYLGQNAAGGRMLLTLDAALPASAVELVREGAYLRVRVHARDDRSLRLISAARDELVSALSAYVPHGVLVEVVHAAGDPGQGI